MPWTEELLTGITLVDEQHKWLVDATNRLHAELSKSTPNANAVGDILFGLVDYTYNHFIMEEELLQRLAYPATEAHKAQHNVFISEVTSLLERHDRGERVSGEALVLLKDWLTQHIMKTDKAYVPFVKGSVVI